MESMKSKLRFIIAAISVVQCTSTTGFNLKTMRRQPLYFGLQQSKQIQIANSHAGDEECGQKPLAYDQTLGWRRCLPAKLGIDQAKLESAIKSAADPKNRVTSILVTRHGYIAAEAYFGCDDESGTSNCTNASTVHHSYSMAKSVTATLIGLAIADGKIPSVDAKAGTWIPQWRYPGCLPRCDGRQNITIRHLMTLTSGLDWSEDWNSDRGVWNFPGQFDLAMMDGAGRSRDPVAYVALQGLRERPDGESYQPGDYAFYSTGDPAVLSQVIQEAIGQSVADYAYTRIFKPIGMTAEWLGDMSGRTRSYARLYATARDFAKFGQLYLDRGRWQGQQLIPRDWIDASLTPCGGLWDSKLSLAQQKCFAFYGFLWHLDMPLRFSSQAPPSLKVAAFKPEELEDLPHDAYLAEGIFGQMIAIIPSLDMIIVRTADDDRSLEVQDRAAVQLVKHIVASVKDRNELQGGPYQIRNISTNQCLIQVDKQKLGPKTSDISVSTCSPARAQHWYLSPLPGYSYVQLRHLATDNCLATSTERATTFQDLHLERCESGKNVQAFMLVSLPHGEKKIVSKTTGLIGDTWQFTPSTHLSTDTVISQRKFSGLISLNGHYQVLLKEDGSLNLMASSRRVWSSPPNKSRASGNFSPPVSAKLLDNGNLVIIDQKNQIVWQSGTAGHGLPPFRLVITNDGQMLLRDSLDEIIWRAKRES
ncbi:MAG: hypothetical protein FJ146_08595 [Deltaproteobacteria bacterium]|nr:hypothetical protein [Deltaproteobacteria bacterium]